MEYKAFGGEVGILAPVLELRRYETNEEHTKERSHEKKVFWNEFNWRFGLIGCLVVSLCGAAAAEPAWRAGTRGE